MYPKSDSLQESRSIWSKFWKQTPFDRDARRVFGQSLSSQFAVIDKASFCSCGDRTRGFAPQLLRDSEGELKINPAPRTTSKLSPVANQDRSELPASAPHLPLP